VKLTRTIVHPFLPVRCLVTKRLPSSSVQSLLGLRTWHVLLDFLFFLVEFMISQVWVSFLRREGERVIFSKWWPIYPVNWIKSISLQCIRSLDLMSFAIPFLLTILPVSAKRNMRQHVWRSVPTHWRQSIYFKIIVKGF
jgi:hypothetical protein